MFAKRLKAYPEHWHGSQVVNFEMPRVNLSRLIGRSRLPNSCEQNALRTAEFDTALLDDLWDGTCHFPSDTNHDFRVPCAIPRRGVPSCCIGSIVRTTRSITRGSVAARLTTGGKTIVRAAVRAKLRLIPLSLGPFYLIA